MASLLGNLARGVGQGLIQRGQTIGNARLEAIRQQSIESRWQRDQNAQAAARKESRDHAAELQSQRIKAADARSKKASKAAAELQKSKAEADKAREDARFKQEEARRDADRKSRKVTEFDKSVARQESNLRKQLSGLRAELDKDPLLSPEDREKRYEAQAGALIDSFQASLRSRLEADDLLSAESSYRGYFEAPEAEPVGAGTVLAPPTIQPPPEQKRNPFESFTRY